MKVNKYRRMVPLKFKGDIKYYLTRRRMWYIGYIYRASKGQQFHNKFITKFFNPHLYFNQKLSTLVKYTYFSKLFNQRLGFNINSSIFGNIDKFIPDYIYDISDQSFQLSSKTFVKKIKYNRFLINTQFYTTRGCTFVTVEPSPIFDEDDFQETVFFFKNRYVANNLCYADTSIDKHFNFLFCSDIDLYFNLEYYKIISLLFLKSC